METKEIENKDYPNGVTLQTSSRKDLSERNQRHETHKSRGRPIEGQSVISYNFQNNEEKKQVTHHLLIGFTDFKQKKPKRVLLVDRLQQNSLHASHSLLHHTMKNYPTSKYPSISMSDSRLSKVQSTDKIKRFPHKILPDSINSKENMWTELGKVRVNQIQEQLLQEVEEDQQSQHLKVSQESTNKFTRTGLPSRKYKYKDNYRPKLNILKNQTSHHNHIAQAFGEQRMRAPDKQKDHLDQLNSKSMILPQQLLDSGEHNKPMDGTVATDSRNKVIEDQLKILVNKQKEHILDKAVKLDSKQQSKLKEILPHQMKDIAHHSSKAKGSTLINGNQLRNEEQHGIKGHSEARGYNTVKEGAQYSDIKDAQNSNMTYAKAVKFQSLQEQNNFVDKLYSEQIKLTKKQRKLMKENSTPEKDKLFKTEGNSKLRTQKGQYSEQKNILGEESSLDKVRQGKQQKIIKGQRVGIDMKPFNVGQQYINGIESRAEVIGSISKESRKGILQLNQIRQREQKELSSNFKSRQMQEEKGTKNKLWLEAEKAKRDAKNRVQKRSRQLKQTQIDGGIRFPQQNNKARITKNSQMSNSIRKESRKPRGLKDTGDEVQSQSQSQSQDNAETVNKENDNDDKEETISKISSISNNNDNDGEVDQNSELIDTLQSNSKTVILRKHLNECETAHQNNPGEKSQTLLRKKATNEPNAIKYNGKSHCTRSSAQSAEQANCIRKDSSSEGLVEQRNCRETDQQVKFQNQINEQVDSAFQGTDHQFRDYSAKKNIIASNTRDKQLNKPRESNVKTVEQQNKRQSFMVGKAEGRNTTVALQQSMQHCLTDEQLINRIHEQTSSLLLVDRDQKGKAEVLRQEEQNQKFHLGIHQGERLAISQNKQSQQVAVQTFDKDPMIDFSAFDKKHENDHRQIQAGLTQAREISKITDNAMTLDAGTDEAMKLMVNKNQQVQHKDMGYIPSLRMPNGTMFPQSTTRVMQEKAVALRTGQQGQLKKIVSTNRVVSGQSRQVQWNMREHGDVDQINQEEEAPFNHPEITRMNETFNMTLNQTKIDKIDKERDHYCRAPILSFLYDLPSECESGQEFIPSKELYVINISQSEYQQKLQNYARLSQAVLAIHIVASIDKWLIERIFEPYLDAEERIGVWLYCRGIWRLILVQGRGLGYQSALLEAVAEANNQYNSSKQQSLADIINMISGTRAMVLKGTANRIIKQLQYNLRRGYVLKVFAKDECKFSHKVLEVVAVETTIRNERLVRIRMGRNDQSYWIKEEVFGDIFDYFLLVCTRNCSYWSHQPLKTLTGQKAVYRIDCERTVKGSLTVHYPSAAPASICLYKEIETKVLKFVGKVIERNNRKGNIYFDFILKGTYYVFLECPQDALIAIEGSNKIMIRFSEYIKSESLRNDHCEYVQISKIMKRTERRADKSNQEENLARMRQQFIEYVSKKGCK